MKGTTVPIRGPGTSKRGGNNLSRRRNPTAAGEVCRSEDRWSGTFDAITDIVCVISPEHTIVEINKAGCDAIGMPREKILGRKCFRQVHATRVPIVGCPCTQAMSTHRPATTTHAQDGRFYELTAWPIVGPNGQAEAFVHVVKDITTRAAAEEEIKRNRDALQVVAAILEMSLRDVPLDRILDEALGAILSIPWLSLEGKGAIFLVDPESRRLVMKAARNLADSVRGACATVNFGKCLCGRAAASRSLVYSSHLDERHETRYPGIGDHGHYCVPLVYENETVGLICAYLPAGRPRRSEEESLLSVVAHALAGVIARRRAEENRDRARQDAERRARQLRGLAAELVNTEQRERRRLASVLHDHIQQLLVAAKFSLGALAGEAENETQRTVAGVLATLDEAIRSTRTLTAELSPPALAQDGLGAGLKWLQDSIKKRHGLNVDMAIEDTLEVTDVSLRVFLFEAVRELLFNVVKHAGVDQAWVEVTRTADRKIRIAVSDAGAGFTPERLGDRSESGGGFGLFSIRERLKYLGGYMEIDSRPGRGSRFVLFAPSPAGSR